MRSADPDVFLHRLIAPAPSSCDRIKSDADLMGTQMFDLANDIPPAATSSAIRSI
jgi:hypothetical protein